MIKDDIIFGIYPILEALQNNKSLDKLYIQKGIQISKLVEIEKLAKKQNVPIFYVPLEKLNRLTRANHQGIIATSSPITFLPFEEAINTILATIKNPLFVVLDSVTDVRNLGAIIRTAECTGVNAIIIPSVGGAAITSDAVKTSAGAIFSVPICKVTHIKDALFYLKASKIKIIGATEKTNNSIYNTNLKEGLALVMGNEEKGISKSVLPLIDNQCALPLLGKINSLNVSVACGVILYEIIRQRNF